VYVVYSRGFISSLPIAVDASELEILYEFFQDYMIDTSALPASSKVSKERRENK